MDGQRALRPMQGGHGGGGLGGGLFNLENFKLSWQTLFCN